MFYFLLRILSKLCSYFSNMRMYIFLIFFLFIVISRSKILVACDTDETINLINRQERKSIYTAHKKCYNNTNG